MYRHIRANRALFTTLAVILIEARVAFAGDQPLEQVLLDAGFDSIDFTIHDPSRVISDGQFQMIAATGKAQEYGYNCGIETWYREGTFTQWKPGQCLFREKPQWINQIIPPQSGAFWAPELVNEKAMYYSVAAADESSPVTCIGLAKAFGEFPNNLTWADSGAPVTCVNKEDWEFEVSAIDPTFLKASDGRAYLVTGGGLIHGTEVDPNTYLPARRSWFVPNSQAWDWLAFGPNREDDYWVEASYIHENDGWFYLFVNWGTCCSGSESTYEIRVGRSESPLGMYYDKDGVSMLEGGGSLLVESFKYMVGPGHVGIWKNQAVKDFISFHYYDKRREGAPWVAERRIEWVDGWPEVGRVHASYFFPEEESMNEEEEFFNEEESIDDEEQSVDEEVESMQAE